MGSTILMSKGIAPILDRITLKQFRAYTAYIRAESIKSAAKTLRTSAPAVSQ